MFDVINIIRERRDMILNFVKENFFKVGFDFTLEEKVCVEVGVRRDMWICLILVGDDRIGYLFFFFWVNI